MISTQFQNTKFQLQLAMRQVPIVENPTEILVNIANATVILTANKSVLPWKFFHAHCTLAAQTSLKLPNEFVVNRRTYQ